MRKNYYINWFPSRNSNYSLQFAYFSLDYIKEKKEVKVESKLQIISPLVNFIFLLKSFKKNFSSSLDSLILYFSDHFSPATAPSEHDTIIRHHEQGSPRGRSNQGIVVRSSSIRHRVEEPSGARNRRIGEELEQRGPMQGRQGRLLQALSSSRVCKRENEACTKLVRSLLDNVSTDWTWRRTRTGRRRGFRCANAPSSLFNSSTWLASCPWYRSCWWGRKRLPCLRYNS